MAILRRSECYKRAVACRRRAQQIIAGKERYFFAFFVDKGLTGRYVPKITESCTSDTFSYCGQRRSAAGNFVDVESTADIKCRIGRAKAVAISMADQCKSSELSRQLNLVVNITLQSVRLGRMVTGRGGMKASH